MYTSTSNKLCLVIAYAIAAGKIASGKVKKLACIGMPKKVQPWNRASSPIAGIGQPKAAPKRTTLARCLASTDVCHKNDAKLAPTTDRVPARIMTYRKL